MATQRQGPVTEEVERQLSARADYLQAMRRLAATVTLVTAGTEHEPVGMAATAVTSITADPPTLLVAVNRQTALFSVVTASGRFCVNLLAARHASLVAVFGGQAKGRERFCHGDWILQAGTPPVLADAAASLVCTTVDEIDVGTHRLFIGTVQTLRLADDVDPLVWMDAGLAQAVRLPA